MTLCSMLHRLAHTLDEDGRPLPVRPWEPPGPLPKRKLTDAGRMFVVACIVAAAFLAVCVLVARFGDYPG